MPFARVNQVGRTSMLSRLTNLLLGQILQIPIYTYDQHRRHNMLGGRQILLCCDWNALTILLVMGCTRA